MAVNRIAQYTQTPEKSAGTADLSAANGFALLPLQAVPGIQDRWNDLQSMYDFAYSLAQVHATNALPSLGMWGWT